MSRVRVVARSGGSATIIEAEAVLVIAVDGTKGSTWRDGDPDRFKDLLPALFDRFNEQGTAAEELFLLLSVLTPEIIAEAKRLLLSYSRSKGGSA